MEVIKKINYKAWIFLLSLVPATQVVGYDFPGSSPVDGVMAANDLFNINSGLFRQSVDNAASTISLNSGVQLNIKQGGIATYSGSNPIAATVYLNVDLLNSANIAVNGRLDAGNAKFALFSEKGVIVTSTLNVTVAGIGVVNGDMYLNSATTSNLFVDEQSAINGNVFFDQNPGAGNVTIGQNKRHQGYVTNGNITGVNTLTVHDGIMQNNNILTFSPGGAKELDIHSAGIFINNGTVANLNIIKVTGTLQLNKDIAVATSIENAVPGGTIQVNNKVTVTTPSFNIANGKYIANFTGLNGFGTLNLPNTNFIAAGNSSDSFIFMRQAGYLPAGDHILVTGNNPPVMPASVITNTNNDIFINSLVINAHYNNIVLTVDRKTFDTLGSNDFNVKIGQALEAIGSNNPSDAAISSLNWFESAPNVTDYNSKLNVFKMLITLPTTSLSVQHQIFSTVANRLAKLTTQSYVAGGNYFINEMWLRASGVLAKQSAYKDLMPYESSMYNMSLGIDSAITNTDRLGLALSVASSNIKSNVANFSNFLVANNTKVLSFQATPYFLREFPSGYYVNVIAGMTFNLYKTQTSYTNLAILANNTNSSRSDALFSLQSTLGTSFVMMNYLHVAVSAALNGSYALRAPFNDQTIPGIELQINPNSAANITVSSKVEFSFPWHYTQLVVYPKLYFQSFYDLLGSKHDVSGRFANYAQGFTTTISHRKARGLIGVALELDLNEEFSLDFNYDHEFNPEFVSKQLTLTAKYRF